MTFIHQIHQNKKQTSKHSFIQTNIMHTKLAQLRSSKLIPLLQSYPHTVNPNT